MSTTTKTMTCQECGQQITPGVNDAIERLYCTNVIDIESLERRLRDLIAQPGLLTTDEEVLHAALEDWFGVDPVALVGAVRHVQFEEAADGND